MSACACKTIIIVIAASGVWAILKRHNIDPTPRRSGPTWAEFFAAQATGLMACDFFHVGTVQFKRLSVSDFIYRHAPHPDRPPHREASPAAGWWRRLGSNQRHHGYEPCALPLSYAAD